MDLGEYQLLGLDRRERLYQVVASGLPREFPPLRGDKGAALAANPRGFTAAEVVAAPPSPAPPTTPSVKPATTYENCEATTSSTNPAAAAATTLTPSSPNHRRHPHPARSRHRSHPRRCPRPRRGRPSHTCTTVDRDYEALRRNMHQLQLWRSNGRSSTGPHVRVPAVIDAAWDHCTTEPLHARGVAYLASRCINVVTLEGYTGRPEVGHTPGSGHSLARRLLGDGFDVDELVDAGLAHRYSDGRITGFYHDRVLIPIRDDNGQIAGLVGRNVGDPHWPNTRTRRPRSSTTRRSTCTSRSRRQVRPRPGGRG